MDTNLTCNTLQCDAILYSHGPWVEEHTPHLYDKKTPNFAQGLDFLSFFLKGKTG